MLKSRLERFDIRVWVDEDEIKAGSSLIRTISAAIEEMAFLAIILTPNSVNSRWVQEELELALGNQIKQARLRVISILFRDCKIPSFLKGKKYIDFTDWSKAKRRKNSHEIFDRSIKQVVKAVGVDPENSERWSGRKMIKAGDFKRKLAEYFAPRAVTVHFFEDESGLDFIKIDNGDLTFELYEYWSKPSYFDLIHKVFLKPGEPPVTDLVIPQALVTTDAERDEMVTEMCLRRGISKEFFWSKIGDPQGDAAIIAAKSEYDEWWFDQSPLALVCDGDFGSRRSK